GDVYELCFTASPQKRLVIEQIGQVLALPLTRVGTIRVQSGLLGHQGDGGYIEISGRGFDHFSGGQP
ncbi:MAG TPA: thiamine-phosphate kinase, partial [Orrella sp.]